MVSVAQWPYTEQSDLDGSYEWDGGNLFKRNCRKWKLSSVNYHYIAVMLDRNKPTSGAIIHWKLMEGTSSRGNYSEDSCHPLKKNLIGFYVFSVVSMQLY